jgi:hypothetical protein
MSHPDVPAKPPPLRLTADPDVAERESGLELGRFAGFEA